MLDIRQIALNFGFSLTEEQGEKFRIYGDFLISENKKYNLTAITDENDIALKHFIDSLYGAKYLFEGASGIDIGSGAGFPGVPLKIFYPNFELTLLDSQTKKAKFLSELTKKLGLSGVSIVNERAETLAFSKKRESYDFAFARAVAELRTLLEYVLPLVKVGGVFLAYKGSKIEEEVIAAKKALNELGGRVESVEEFSVAGVKRGIVVVRKLSETPNRYPRTQNKPKILPL